MDTLKIFFSIPLLGLASLVSAQFVENVTVVDRAPPFRQFDKVEITGSAILARQAREALPVQVLTQREIAQSGASDLPSLLQRLSVMQNFTDAGLATGSVLGGPETAAIHGNQSGTLVLLNGRRLPFYGSQTLMGERAVVDLNFIPLSAVERIEVLTDGASARYGSDAVAGVVNVITRSQVRGATVGVETVLPSLQGGASRGLQLSWGTGSLDRDGHSLRVHASLSQQDAVLAGWRQVAQNGVLAVDVNGQPYWSVGNNWTWYSAPGRNYVAADGSFRNSHYEAQGRCEASWYEVASGYCARNSQPVMTLYPATDKRILFAQGERMLDNRWVLFGDVLWGQQTQSMVPRGQYYTFEQAGPGNTTYLMESVPWGLLEQRYTNDMRHAVVGLKGEAAGWDFALNASHGSHQVVREYTGGLRQSGVTGRVLPQEIGLDPAQYSTGTLAWFDANRRSQALLLDNGRTTLNTVGLLMSRHLMDLDAGPLLLGLGLDGRQESSVYTPGESFAATRPAWQGTRTIWAAHGELQWPVTSQLETTAALRHDRYSDFGDVTTGKLGWKWRVSDHMWWRGSLGTGFRAPTLGQMAPVQSAFATQGVYQLVAVGSPALRPERSQQWTLGVHAEPSRQWALGADVWNLDIRDTFGRLSLSTILASDALKAQYLVAGQPAQVLMPNINLGRSVAQGVDYYLRWRQPVEHGRWQLSLRGTTLLKSMRDSGEGMVSDLGRYSRETESFALRHRLSLVPALEHAGWTYAAALNYSSGRTEPAQLLSAQGDALELTRRVASFTTMDWMVYGQWNKQWHLSAALLNVGNRLPQLTLAQTQVISGVDTRAADYYGRRVQLKAQYRF